MAATKPEAAQKKARPRGSEQFPPKAYEAEAGRALRASWFEARAWTILPHQAAAWEEIEKGASGLLQMPTGSGKTYAAFMGYMPLLGSGEEGLQLLYITPLRALARDIELAIAAPCRDLGLHLRVESRTGDTNAAQRRKQKIKLPQVLITTPESLALLLSYESAAQDFAKVRGIIIDEWHELLSSKRGSLLELNLARIRSLAPAASTWALSATLANSEEAARAACGREARIISGRQPKDIVLRTILPSLEQRLPRAGHIGLGMLPHLLTELNLEQSSLIFANTRTQAELWYEALRLSRPEWEGQMALHHGSLDQKVREEAENGVKSGAIRIVVCTSTLDLGVDFPEVDRVFQIGSPKRISRLVQRAGRSGHGPGRASVIHIVPTYGIELLEVLACRRALDRKALEARAPLPAPLDVLIQHLVSSALAGGFAPDALFAEIREAYGYRELTRERFDWALAFVVSGGGTLKAYPQYCKVVFEDGLYRVRDRTIALRHRQNLGTILGDASIRVALGRRSLGHIDENFVARLKAGDRFLFGGRWLEFIRIHELTAYTRLARGKGQGTTPTFSGQKLPWSTVLSTAIREMIDAIDSDASLSSHPEYGALEAILLEQTRVSLWPAAHELLAEKLRTREGQHFFLYPFEGQAVHEGLAALLIHRLSARYPASYATAANNFGFEILSSIDIPWNEELLTLLLSSADLEKDLRAAVNHTELSRRRFRGVARIAGLVLQNVPGRKHSGHQLQTSAGLLFDVLRRFDPGNLLVEQAEHEVLIEQFEAPRLAIVLERLRKSVQIWTEPPTFSPLAHPLQLERIGARLSTESWQQRIERSQRPWQSSYGKSRGKVSRSSQRKRSTGRAADR